MGRRGEIGRTIGFEAREGGQWGYTAIVVTKEVEQLEDERSE